MREGKSRKRRILGIVVFWLVFAITIFGAFVFSFGKGQLQTVGILILLGLIAWPGYRLIVVPLYKDIQKIITIVREE